MKLFRMIASFARKNYMFLLLLLIIAAFLWGMRKKEVPAAEPEHHNPQAVQRDSESGDVNNGVKTIENGSMLNDLK